jgi:hypothetical protein
MRLEFLPRHMPTGGGVSNETHFHVGAFRDAAQLQPTRHIFPEERLPWLHLGG